MPDFERIKALIHSFARRRILVLGDVILDRYWWGEASRLSPEAPVPVVQKRRASARPGGAANTAANLAALGAHVELLGLVGRDRVAEELRETLRECGVDPSGLLESPERPTTAKTRIIALHQHIVRVDEEETAPVSAAQEEAALSAVAGRLPAADALVISDYAKGFLSPGLLQGAIGLAQRAGKPAFIDPKGADWTRYRGAAWLKPNRAELSVLTGLPVQGHEDTRAAAARLLSLLPETQLLVTEGADGMTVFSASGERHIRCEPRQVYDVTGAGDTVLAAFALALTSGASPEEAIWLATQAAAITISVMGTAIATSRELLAVAAPHGERVTP